MKKQNGFIATSLIYTFFLAFIALFVGLLTIHLKNRVYLIKLDNSSKNSIYIHELEDLIKENNLYYNTSLGKFNKKENDCYTFSNDPLSCYKLTKCKKIYKSTYKDAGQTITFFHLEGCEKE